MNVEHCDCLSWFSREGRKPKARRRDAVGAAAMLQYSSAAGDPAMAFGPSSDMDGPMAVLLIGSFAALHAAGASCASPLNARDHPARNFLTANTQPFDQLLVTPFVRAPQIIENLAPLRHHLEQAAPRMV